MRSRFSWSWYSPFGLCLRRYGGVGAESFIWSLEIFFLWIRLRLRNPAEACTLQRWGVVFDLWEHRCVMLYWGKKSWQINLPWHLWYERTYFMDSSGSWVLSKNHGFSRSLDWKRLTYHFHYTTNSGLLEKAEVGVFPVCDVRRYSLFRLLRLPLYRNRYSLILEFSKPLGDKGGVCGAIIPWNPKMSAVLTISEYEKYCNKNKVFCK